MSPVALSEPRPNSFIRWSIKRTYEPASQPVSPKPPRDPVVCPLGGSTDPGPRSEASPVANAPSGAQNGPGWDREGQNQNFDFFLNPRRCGVTYSHTTWYVAENSHLYGRWMGISPSYPVLRADSDSVGKRSFGLWDLGDLGVYSAQRP